ncbi:EamA family transporter [Salmonella enterica]|nr:EamA family transporter [Salmonella enterica]
MMSRKDGFLALLVVVVWGLNFVVIKVGLHHMPPLLLAGLRFLLVAFPAIFFVARPQVPLTLLLGYGLTISFGQFAFLFCAIKFGMPAGLASLVLQAQAFFTMALGAFVFSERLQRKQLAGIALAIIGVLTIDMTTILSLLYLAFVATILGYGIWGALLGRYETWRVAPLSLLVPVVGLASAAVLLGETLTGMRLAGAVLIMAGLYINVFGFRVRRTARVRG